LEFQIVEFRLQICQLPANFDEMMTISQYEIGGFKSEI